MADPIPEREYEESGNKARAVLKALEIAHRGGGEESGFTLGGESDFALF